MDEYKNSITAALSVYDAEFSSYCLPYSKEDFVRISIDILKDRNSDEQTRFLNELARIRELYTLVNDTNKISFLEVMTRICEFLSVFGRRVRIPITGDSEIDNYIHKEVIKVDNIHSASGMKYAEILDSLIKYIYRDDYIVFGRVMMEVKTAISFLKKTCLEILNIVLEEFKKIWTSVHSHNSMTIEEAQNKIKNFIQEQYSNTRKKLSDIDYVTDETFSQVETIIDSLIKDACVNMPSKEQPFLSKKDNEQGISTDFSDIETEKKKRCISKVWEEINRNGILNDENCSPFTDSTKLITMDVFCDDYEAEINQDIQKRFARKNFENEEGILVPDTFGLNISTTLTDTEVTETRRNLIIRIKQEVTDSMNMCVLGNITRLVTPFMGFYPNVKIGVGIGDQMTAITDVIRRKVNEDVQYNDTLSEEENENIRTNYAIKLFAERMIEYRVEKDIVDEWAGNLIYI